MTETDPFGRSKDDDPLAEMGWSTSGIAKPHEGPADVFDPERPDRAAQRRARRAAEQATRPGIPGQQRRNRLGCAFAVAVVMFIAATAAVVGSLALDAGVVTDGEGVTPTVVEEPAAPDDGGRAPRGLEQASLLRRGNLVPALRRLRRITRSSRVNLIRIDAQSVIVTVPVDGERTRVARATWNGEGEVLSTSPGGGGGASFTWSRIDPSAPQRIVRAATRGREARAFDHLVLIDASGLRWSAFLKGGGTFSAVPDGSAVSRAG